MYMQIASLSSDKMYKNTHIEQNKLDANTHIILYKHACKHLHIHGACISRLHYLHTQTITWYV